MNNIDNYKNFVLPKVYLVGFTGINLESLITYLSDTNQREFIDDILEARKNGVNDAEILCSFYAKLCYSSLIVGKNKNISKTRDIKSNLENVIETGHYSVIEHCQLNFLVTNCSRIFTHEQVRHRLASYSQTSGRYVRNDVLNVVIDPILEPAYDLVEEVRNYLETWYKRLEDRLKVNEIKDFSSKKKLTSAMRRLLPNGQSNELGFSINLRSLRHIIQLRTSRHAEWEIRYIYNQIFNLVKNKYSAVLFDAKTEMVDNLMEITFDHKEI